MKTTQPHRSTIGSLVFLTLQSVLVLSCGKLVMTPKDSPPTTVSVTSGYVEINAVKLYYEITGEGEPLFLIHGGLSGSDYFKGIIPGLATTYKVITVDRRGHGRSYDNAEPYSYATMADEMKAFLDHLHIESVNMLGFSDGGVVGYHLASTYPQKVGKLIAVGANYSADSLTPEAIEWITNQATPEGLAKDSPEIEKEYKATNPQPENFAAFLKRSRALWLHGAYLTKDQMMKIQAPVLFLVGEKDHMKIEYVLEMRTLVKNSQMCVLPGASHLVLSEKPEVVLPIIMDFFKSRS